MNEQIIMAVLTGFTGLLAAYFAARYKRADDENRAGLDALKQWQVVAERDRREIIAHLERENDDLKKRIGEAESRAAGYEVRVVELEAKINQLRAEIVRLYAELGR